MSLVWFDRGYDHGEHLWETARGRYQIVLELHRKPRQYTLHAPKGMVAHYGRLDFAKKAAQDIKDQQGVAYAHYRQKFSLRENPMTPDQKQKALIAAAVAGVAAIGFTIYEATKKPASTTVVIPGGGGGTTPITPIPPNGGGGAGNPSAAWGETSSVDGPGTYLLSIIPVANFDIGRVVNQVNDPPGTSVTGTWDAGVNPFGVPSDGNNRWRVQFTYNGQSQFDTESLNWPSGFNLYKLIAPTPI